MHWTAPCYLLWTWNALIWWRILINIPLVLEVGVDCFFYVWIFNFLCIKTCTVSVVVPQHLIMLQIVTKCFWIHLFSMFVTELTCIILYFVQQSCFKSTSFPASSHLRERPPYFLVNFHLLYSTFFFFCRVFIPNSCSQVYTLVFSYVNNNC